MKEKIIAIVSKVLGVPESEISEDSSPDTIPSWDSLSHMNLILALEEELGVQFTDEQIVEMNSVGIILAVVAEIC